MSRRKALLALALCAPLLVVFGCGDKYPEAKVKSPLDRPGTCQQCGKAIPKVGPEHLLTIKAAQYIVCDEKCAAKTRTWHEAQFGK
jgi:hypothetical protein